MSQIYDEVMSESQLRDKFTVRAFSKYPKIVMTSYCRILNAMIELSPQMGNLLRGILGRRGSMIAGIVKESFVRAVSVRKLERM